MRVDLIRSEFPSGQFPMKHHVQLIISSTSAFWQSEERPDCSHRCGRCPDERRLTLQIGLSRVNQVRFDDLGNDIGDVVNIA